MTIFLIIPWPKKKGATSALNHVVSTLLPLEIKKNLLKNDIRSRTSDISTNFDINRLKGKSSRTWFHGFLWNLL